MNGDTKNISFFLENNENNILYSFPKKHEESFYTKSSKKLIDLLDVINGTLKEPTENITCSMKSDKPIKLQLLRKEYEIIYLLAQLSKKDGEGIKK
jgi:hypothetical protein